MSDGSLLRSPRTGTLLRAPSAGALLRTARAGTLLRGTRGAPWPAGVSAETLIRLASGPLSGQRVVRDLGNGDCAYPNMAVATDGEFILGVTTMAADDGAAVVIQIGGEMIEPSWTWTPGPVFVAANGQITQSPGGTAFLRQIGLAVAATKIVIGLQPPIVTAP